MKSDRQQLIERFDQMKHPVEDVRLAWTGLYPHFFGFWGLGHHIFTRTRCLALVDQRVELWSVWPPFPKKMVASSPLSEVTYLRGGRRYDRVQLGAHRVWTRAADREHLLEWVNPGTV